MNKRDIQAEVMRLLPARKGHFRLESGHHGDLWLDLETLCLRPAPIQGLAAELAARLAAHGIEAVCGPLVEGAFAAIMVAAELSVLFTYTERGAATEASKEGDTALYPARYFLPRALRARVRGKRVAIVNDVINAGSAIRGTFADLKACGAEPVAIAALAVLGESAGKFAADHKLVLESLVHLPNQIWTPAECPLCNGGVPLEDFLGPTCPS